MERTTEIIHKRIEKILAYFIDVLNLQEWNYTVKFEEKLDDDIAASVIVDDDYLSFSVFFDSEKIKDTVKDKDYDEVTRWILHELIHVIVDPLYFIAVDGVTNTSIKFLKQKRENTVERFTNIIMKGVKVSKLWR